LKYRSIVIRGHYEVCHADQTNGNNQGLHKLTPNVGAYAQYVGATDVVLMKIPDHMSFEQAASLGTGIGTMGLALFHSLNVPGYPTDPATNGKTVLVYGGSTASGTLALQLLKMYVSVIMPHSSPYVHRR